ncbi:D-alanyl-D-alanine carboxypeptidase-like protein [Promicromonospora sp. AC04]|uniref:M15 family metallopeptidase n=1 Tax=Promicromonospora sp. AC04 TaxID=2135723 RepID=UPI000D474DCD|nr:M15 family metallopeptidase [Promicromonospora sp. AC04]PUB23956.1 D-alanyl-D-alanine carboxypeptidase-like protein [Promicromonospora sp. AC04]
MRRGDHTLVPRRTRRPGAQGAHAAVPAAGHFARSSQLVRRSSFALAAALTTVALTTTAAVSFTGNDGGAVGSSGGTAAAEPAVVTATSAVAIDHAVKTAAAKADAVLTDADYVTREGDLTVKDRKQVRAAAKKLRTMLEQARDTAGTAVETRLTAAASRSTDRTSLAERATDTSATAETTDEATTETAAAVEPTNLAGAVAGVTPIIEQEAEDLPVLDTPLADSVSDTAEAQEAAEKTSDAKDAAETSADATAPSADRIEKVATSLQKLITKTDGDAVVSVKAGPTPEEIAAAKKAAEERREARAARAAERKAAARAAEAKEMAEAAKNYGNGQIPSSVLCGLSWTSSEQLRCDAALALEDLNSAFRAAFGRNLDLTDGYRSYSEQVTVAATRGALAAVPGTSNHGWGQAVDLSGGIESFGTAEHNWMVANAGKYGWEHPAWAQAGGSKPEAWHWEYGTTY